MFYGGNCNIFSQRKQWCHQLLPKSNIINKGKLPNNIQLKKAWLVRKPMAAYPLLIAVIEFLVYKNS